jgi:hypothetical protein
MTDPAGGGDGGGAGARMTMDRAGEIVAAIAGTSPRLLIPSPR